MTADQPRRLQPDDPDLSLVLDLIRGAFAYMDGVINPPSSVHRLTLANLQGPEVWVNGHPPLACVVLTPEPGRLYLGKLAVANAVRGQGHARSLVQLACARARTLGLPVVELQVRVELTANQALFQSLGFTACAHTAHPGFDRPTSITFRRLV